MDREDGVRRAGRHRADLRLAAARPTSSSAPALIAVGLRACSRAPPAGGSRCCPRRQLYVLGALLIGDRDRDPGRGRRRHEHRGGAARRCRRQRAARGTMSTHDLGMVQVLGRLALSFGIFAVAGLSGWLASMMLAPDRVPARPDRAGDLGDRRVAGAAWRPASSGRSTGASSAAASSSARAVVALGVGGMPFSQEIIFVDLDGRGDLRMLVRVTQRARPRHAHAHLSTPPSSSSPSAPRRCVGDGYLLVGPRRARLRRGVLRRAAADSARSSRIVGDVAVQPSRSPNSR